MTNEELFQDCLGRLMADVEEADEFPRPLLAHYCSVSTLESMLKGRQLWLSNPLYMNDLEEVRFGINTGMRLALGNASLREALASDEREKLFFGALENLFNYFANEHVFDLYVACFSAHDPDEDDGRLSMWRAYGASGNGAALVFDVNSVSKPGVDYSGLLLGRVHYGTAAEREGWLEVKVLEAADLVRELDVPIGQLPLIAAALFERIKLMAVFSKHIGFAEEREWRLVYLSEHDAQKRYEQHLGYHLGPRGVEPKLKLPIHGAVPWLDNELNVESLVHRIILGPSVSNPLAKRSIGRMLDVVGFPDLKDKLRACSIPLRSNGFVPG